MNNKLEEVLTLKSKLETEFPSASFTVESFDSGAIAFEIRLGERLIVVDYYLKHGFCVDEIGDDTGFNSGYADCFDNLIDVENKLQLLLMA